MRRDHPKRIRVRLSAASTEALEPRQLLSVAAAATPMPYTVLQAGLANPQGSSTPDGAPLTPAKMRDAYGLGTYGSSDVTFNGVQGTGAGQTIAIIAGGNDPTIANDLAGFDSYWGLPAPPSFTVMNASGQTTNLPANGDEGETSLDVEWSHVMAPGATIDLFEGGLYTGITTAKNTPGVSVISISYTISGTQTDSFFETPSGHTGVTVLAAAGDTAGTVSEPARSASVIDVGGTDLHLDGTSYSSESAWSAGGGGIATNEAQPAYQAIKAAPFSTTNRTTPDVSMDADPSTGVAVYNTTSNTAAAPWSEIIGGTSLATPLMAGVIAVADQGRAVAGLTPMDGYTQTLPRLYTLPADAFHDITTGANANPAEPGYDLATGLGSVAGNYLIPDLAGADTVTGQVFIDANGDGTYDAGDAPLAGQTVYLDLNDSGVQTSVDPTTTTNASGVYSFADQIGGITGAVRLVTTPAGDLHSTTATTFTTSYDADQTVNIGLYKSAYAATASPTTVTGTTTNLSTTGTAPADASTFTFTWAATTVPSGGSATFSVNGTAGSGSTTATFTKAGSYTFTLTISDGQGGAVTTTVNVTVVQTPTALAVSPATANVSPGGTEQLSAVVVDQFGNGVTSGATVTYALVSGNGTVSSSGLYTAPSTGTQAVVRATAGSLTGTSTLDVLTAPFTSTDIGGPTLAGSGYDASGTFTIAGSGTGLAAAADQLQYVYQTLTGDGGILARVVTQGATAANAFAGVMIRQSLAAGSAMASMGVTPADGLEFASRSTAGGTLSGQFTTTNTATYWVKLVRSGNAFGGYYSPDGVTWTAAFAALIPMTDPVYIGLAVSSATNAARSTATFDHVTVSPAVATAAAASASPVTGTTTTLSVLGADAANGASNLTYAWRATTVPSGAVAPTFSANGTNAAQSTVATFTHAGTYAFKVTITDAAGLATSSSVSVTVNATVTSIVVAPSTATVSDGQTAQFTASARDQFGLPLTTQPTFTWSVANGGVGTVSSTGLYTAPASGGGSATVLASVGSVSGSATVAVPTPTVAVASPGVVSLHALASRMVVGATGNAGGAAVVYIGAASEPAEPGVAAVVAMAPGAPPTA